jgi:hypothetical protein
MGDALRTKVVEIRRRSTNVVIQTAVDFVVTGTVAVLGIVVVEQLEDAAGLRELGSQAVVHDVAELDSKDDVLFALVVDDPLQRFSQDFEGCSGLRRTGIACQE